MDNEAKLQLLKKIAEMTELRDKYIAQGKC
jgi:hypothetical protein